MKKAERSARIQTICAELPRGKVFADVGCDHGYCAEYMLASGKCERAYVTDVSAASLKKAETLLAEYVKSGRCASVCCDGLSGIPERCDCVLIAGMGGEEIVKILSESGLPEKFAVQPMKNSEKVRRFIVGRGGKIERDFSFSDGGKYYDFISGFGAGGDCYTDYEYAFGRDNLRAPSRAFYEKIKEEQRKLRAVFGAGMSEKSREEIAERLRMLGEVTDAIEEDL